ncbi:MAG: tRNA (N(6)-L-threonylcarbamoyladenosine(37)-C(2))-methylthiotransferase MtaB [Deltaproteobacteria bacterium]|nr:tRNA (N(6)-L-threonylcarbamoyladenosine(37)-C(2))-methylthiotransferase MtaB [Deltaproteobacteria bacterium]
MKKQKPKNNPQSSSRVREKASGIQDQTSGNRDPAPGFSITTLGCKVNQYESDAMARCLELSEWIPESNVGEAELCIINTCTVTRKAAMQSRQAVRQAIRSNPGARIIVTGCYAQTEPEEVKKIAGVHYIIGHADKHKIPEIITSDSQKNPLHSLPCPEIIRQDIGKERLFGQIPVTAFGNRTRPVLKIQDGCDAFCTYCIVPYARGRSRSMPRENVLENIRQLNKAGFREVVLSGIHLGCYGLDLSPKTSLVELMKQVRTSDAVERVRLSSIEPHELTEAYINLVGESDIFCNHFHIPLQSGDDRILKRMNRPYTTRLFREQVHRIRKQIPDAAIGADVMVGFPGETEDAFNNTRALIDELPVSYLHVFPFSARDGTPAGKYPDPVAPDVIKTRALKMRQLGNAKISLFYTRFVKEKIEVLVEGKPNDPEGSLKGISSNYIPVLFKGDGHLKNTFVNVRIEAVNPDNSVFGTICNNRNGTG